jgi:hypothetical protein
MCAAGAVPEPLRLLVLALATAYADDVVPSLMTLICLVLVKIQAHS